MKDKIIRAINLLGGKTIYAVVSGVVVVVFLISGFTVDRTVNSRTQKNGFDEKTNNEVTIGTVTFYVPKYWNEREDDYFKYLSYAETGNSVACIEVIYRYDDEDIVSFEELKDETEAGLMTEFIEKEFDGSKVSYTEYNNGNVRGFIFDIEDYIVNEEIKADGIFLAIPSEKDNSWINIIMLQTENTEYRYDNDFMKILNSIEMSN